MIGARVQYLLLGIAGGLAFWLLQQIDEEIAAGRLLLALGVFSVTFFGGALGMLSELGLRRSVIGAAGLGVVVSLLALWESLGFATAGQMLSAGHALVAVATVAALPVPFLIAAGLPGGKGWSDYRILFMESWNIVVRYGAAWLFVGIVWMVLMLGGELLELVGITFLTEILREDIVVSLVCGAALGLGLSVVAEMSDMVSPYLLLRLLRLLTPVVLGLVVIFLAALPVRGLTHLFGGISPSGVLLGMAWASISLVSIAVDQDDIEAVHGPLLAWAGRGLALVLPALAALAGWGIALRVQDHGWTPDRVMAATVAAVVLGYAGLYALSVLAGRGWMAWIRRANIVMALALIALGVLWLSPLINPEKISSHSQMARFAAGELTPSELPLWEFKSEWGNPGALALAELQQTAQDPAQGDLAKRLEKLASAESRYDLPGPDETDLDLQVDGLRGAVTTVAAVGEAPEALWIELVRMNAPGSAADCATKTAAGNGRCVLVLADFRPELPGEEAIFFRARPDGALETQAYRAEGGRWLTTAAVPLVGAGSMPADVLIDTLSGQAPALVPSGIMALEVGGAKFTVSP
ncbi:DUF4153 domain-containing protein [Sedimentimonas flavescens]|uniref:DUF4153 domain-containing protein n=1 Tax=Sedimentimonas flavescens TaxID=2851012 RepID=A0ABT2ZWR2_9RHOB|nr:DUF4153 domain-containing protein [Sedimentimonas flavescens]MCV2878076.1 DUF4153 domain-containing protein [Sedimentimonas flavescens]